MAKIATKARRTDGSPKVRWRGGRVIGFVGYDHDAKEWWGFHDATADAFIGYKSQQAATKKVIQQERHFQRHGL